jgi:photosystem II stability/assembly factor-like uncharacterized protein
MNTKRLFVLGLLLVTLALAGAACGSPPSVPGGGSPPSVPGGGSPPSVPGGGSEAPSATEPPPAPTAETSVPVSVSTSTAPETEPATAAATDLSPTIAAAAADEPTAVAVELAPAENQPYVVDELYFGVPAGNGAFPSLVAVDGPNRVGYTLNRGSGRQGNTLSAINLDTQQVIGLADFENPGPFGAPDPLAIAVDPYRPRVYALVGDRYAETPVSNLIILDSDTLLIVEVVPAVDAFAVGPQRLFMANDTSLWTLDAERLTPMEEVTLSPRKYNSPMALNPRLGRIYLGRGNPSGQEPSGWSLEVFDTADLTPVTSFPTPGEFEYLAVEVDAGRVYLVESDSGPSALRVLDADGMPLADQEPIPLSGEYQSFPMAIGGDVLFVNDGDYDDYMVRRFLLPDLTPLPALPLSGGISDLVADGATGALYTLGYSFGGPLDAFDAEGAPAGRIFTAVNLIDALVDPAAGRLYLLDEAGHLRLLRLEDLSEERALDVGFSAVDDLSTGAGELSLDPSRGRLYIGGCPVRSVDTLTMEVTVYEGVCGSPPSVPGGGQVTPDPGGDRVYLTPPCHCRLTQCNTLVLSADEMTGTQALYAPDDPFVAPCPVRTLLDPTHQLLYVKIYNGTPGSNSGDYFSVWDVSAAPQAVYTDTAISFGHPALDTQGARAFFSRYRMDRTWLQRYGETADGFEKTLTLAGAGGQLTYDETNDRLFAVGGARLSVFDGDLAMLGEMSLPDGYETLALDETRQRLFLGGDNGQLLVVAEGGGELKPPPPPPKTDSSYMTAQRIEVALDGTMFRLLQGWLYRSDDRGESWHQLGRGLPSRQWDALALSPNFPRDGTLFVARRYYGSDGAVYRSTNGGETWQPATRGLTDLNVAQLVFSPDYAADATVFAVAPNTGIFRSLDGGDTWALMLDVQDGPEEGDAFQGYRGNPVDQLALSPTFGEDRLMLINWTSLLRSNDGGETWEKTGVPKGELAFSPNFAEDGLILSGGAWRSTDGGATWEPAAAGLETADYGTRRILFSSDFARDGTVYILLDQGYNQPVILQRSVDGGQSWHSLAEGALQDVMGDMPLGAVAVLPQNELYLSPCCIEGVSALDTGGGVIVAPDALDWAYGEVAARQADEEELQEVQSLVVDSDGALYAAHSAHGIFRSQNGGRSWEALPFPVRGGWADTTRLTAADDGTLFAALDAAIVRSRDGGDSWEFLEGVPTEFRPTSLAVSPTFSRDGVVVAGGSYHTRQLIRSADEGDTWQVVFDGSDNQDASEMSAVAISPNPSFVGTGYANDGMMYAWLQYAGLLVSEDAGLTWTLRESDESDYYGETLLISPDGKRLYLGALYGHVLVSEDMGRTWANVGANIPDDRVWSRVLLFDAAGALYLGTDVGVYRSLDGGQSWRRASYGLPLDPETSMPLPVTAMAAYGEYLYASLYPYGIYVSDDQAETWRSAATGEPASPTQSDLAPEAAAPDATPTLPPASQQTVDCPFQPGYFADMWGPRASVLGCPVASDQVQMATQSFETGLMFWRSMGSTDQTSDAEISAAGIIYVLPESAPYSQHADTWNETLPAYSCPELGPSQTPPTPQRGFGKVWCEVEAVRRQLGDATSEEEMIDVTMQEFEAGMIFQTTAGDLYVLPDSGAWEQVR